MACISVKTSRRAARPPENTETMIGPANQAKVAGAVLSAEELLTYVCEERRRWQAFFAQHPEALDLHLDIAQAKTVREVVMHILLVDQRYAERLLNQPITEYGSVPMVP